MPISKITNNSVTTDVLGPGKNLIINGAMQVAQRGTSFTGVTGTQFGVDRFNYFLNNSGTFTVEQSTDAPDGFSNSIKLSCTVADASLASGDYDIFQQRIEGQNLQHLKYGTSNAEKVTLSFWVKSNLTGNFVVEIQAVGNGYKSIQYSINSANTWEYKTLTYTGLTTATIDNDNTNGLEVSFWLASGSTYNGGTHTDDAWHSSAANRAAGLNQNLSGSTSNTWQVTGVQLEVGETATPFEHRSFQDEITRCKRYYQKSFPYGTAPFNNAGQGGTRWDERTAVWPPNSYSSATYTGAWCHLSVPLRVAPTTTQYNCNTLGTSGSYLNDIQNSNQSNSYAITATTHNTEKLRFYSGGLSSYGNALGVNWEADAEL